MPAPQPPLKPLERSVFKKLAQVLLSMWDRINNAWRRWAELNQHSRWFPFLIAFLVGFDSFIIILPGDSIVALATLSNPPGWRKTAIFSGVGGALGAFALYMVLHIYGKAPINAVSKQMADIGAPSSLEEVSDLDDEDEPDDVTVTAKTVAPAKPVVVATPVAAIAPAKPPKPPLSARWQSARAFFEKYGLFSLALSSLLPAFTWPPVVLAGLTSDKWFQVLIWLVIGRQLRYWILCFGLREGWAMFTTLKKEAREQKEQREHMNDGGG